MYQPLQHDATACQHETKRVATVVFHHGDEVLRQWYRKYVTHSSLLENIFCINVLHRARFKGMKRNCAVLSN